MEFTQLGQSGIEVSKLCLGTWAIGGFMWGGADDARSVRTIHTAIDKGITFIDTAPVYGFGRSEEVVGKAIASKARDKLVIATKLGLEWTRDEKIVRNSTPARIHQEVDDSLRRLQTSYIDLYQVHWPDPKVSFEQTGEVLAKLKEAGKIRAIGVSNYDPIQMDAFAKGAVIDSVQSPYNLFERQIESDVIPHARRRGMAVLAYGAICRGLLSGKQNANSHFSGDDLRKTDPKFQMPRFGQYLGAVDALAGLAKERHDRSILALALRWTIDQNAVALWGARKPEQLGPVDDVLGWRLSSEDKRDIDAILHTNIADPVGPEFMAPPARA